MGSVTFEVVVLAGTGRVGTACCCGAAYTATSLYEPEPLVEWLIRHSVCDEPDGR